MNEFLRTCLIVCPLVFLAGFVGGVAGGAGIISLPAYLMAGIPTHLAVGTNKVVNGTGMVAATVKFLRSGKVNLKVSLIACISSVLASGVGTKIAAGLPEDVYKIILVIALPIVAVFLVVKHDFGEDGSHKELTPTQEIVLPLCIGLGGGLYEGVIGAGAGTFMLMAFTAFMGMDMISAAACTNVVNFAAMVSAIFVWILEGKVWWALAVPAVICSLVGNYCGVRYALAGGSKRVKNMMFVVLGLLFIKMAFDLFI